jgi:hypothetical protein
MSRTPNHGYNVPEEGEQDWHRPLNENFEAYDTDIEVRDETANLDSYEPAAGAKFLATDTGVVYVGDGSDWLAMFQAGRYTPPSSGEDAGGLAFGDPANEAGSAGATVGGGRANEATRSHATVGGGDGNSAADKGATVGGGIDNRASGEGATVAGGQDNVAMGDHSFAAGRKAEAQRTGSFVWNNSGNRFVASDENQFLVNALGGVGIGTSSPDAPFHVRGSDDPARSGDLLVGTSTAHLSVSVVTEGSHAGTSQLRAVGEDGDRHALQIESGDAQLTLHDGGNNYRPYFAPQEHEGANLGLGDELEFRAIFCGHGFFEEVYESSDASLKENVSRLDSGLESVTDLRPVTFEWKDDDRDDGTQLGLIAQEVEEVLPEVVETKGADGQTGDATLALNYSKLAPVLIDAIQRQQEGIEDREERIDDLEAENEQKDERIDALEAQNADLEERLAALEAQVGADAAPATADD